MDNKKSILVFGLNNTRGGVEKYLLSIQKELTNVEFNYIVNDNYCIFGEQILQNKGKYNLIDANNLFVFIIKVTIKLLQFRKKGDYIYLNMNDPCCLNLILLVLSFFFRYKVICHSHSAQAPILKNGFRKFTHNIIIHLSLFLLNRKSVTRLAVSHKAGKYLYGNLDFEILWAGIKTQDYKFEEKTRCAYRSKLGLENEFVLMLIGRLEEIKNPLLAIKIFNEVHQLKPNSTLLILGEGPLLESCKQLTVELGLDRNVLFLGFILNVNDYLSVGDAVIGCSDSEGMSIVCMEAQASGLQFYCISNNYPEEIALSDLVIFMDKSSSPKEWANIIINSAKHSYANRTEYNSYIGKTKIDLKYVARLMTNYIYG